MVEIEIPSSVHEENAELVHQEDEQPPSPTGIKILESEHDTDIEEKEFQEGMIFALWGIARDIETKDDQEVEGIEQPTVPEWFRERLKMNTLVVEEQEEDDMADFLARLEQTAAKKPTKRFSTIQRDETGNCTV